LTFFTIRRALKNSPFSFLFTIKYQDKFEGTCAIKCVSYLTVWTTACVFLKNLLRYPHMVKTTAKTAFWFSFYFYGFRQSGSAVFGGVLT